MTEHAEHTTEHDENVDPDTTDVDTGQDTDLEDFDAFWTSQDREGKRVRIFGEVVTLPPSLPLQFELEARKLQRSKSDKDVTKLLTILFGEDPMRKWAKAGMDIEQFQVLLAWAPRVVAGQDVSLADVREQVRKAQTEDRPTKRQKP